jgi:hypothetical protein
MAKQCHTARDFGKDHVSWLSMTKGYARFVPRQADNTFDWTYVVALVEVWRTDNLFALRSGRHAWRQAIQRNILSFAS